MEFGDCVRLQLERNFSLQVHPVALERFKGIMYLADDPALFASCFGRFLQHQAEVWLETNFGDLLDGVSLDSIPGFLRGEERSFVPRRERE